MAEDNIQAIDNTFFGSQQIIPNTGSYIGPAICGFQGILFAVWRGSNDDNSIYWSVLNNDGWSPQQNTGFGTGYMPSMAVFGNTLYMAWRGSEDDNGIYWSNYDGSGWVPQQNISGVSSAFGPTLATYQGALYAGWRGQDNDNGIYWSTFDGSEWATQQNISGVGTAVMPSLAVHNKTLYAAWRGNGDDEGNYWSTFNGSEWAPQERIQNVSSSSGPALASFNQRLYATWRGSGDDNGIYWSTMESNTGWGPQQRIGNVATGNRVSIASLGGLLFLAWKGMDDDQGIYWTTGWCLSVNAVIRNWSQIPLNTEGPEVNVSRIDLFTMSRATTIYESNQNDFGGGPYQTWSASGENGGDWDASLNDWVNLDDESFSSLGANPCIPLAVTQTYPQANLIFYVDMSRKVVVISEFSDRSSMNMLGWYNKLTVAENYEPLFLPGSPVCAVARITTELHLFAVGYDGKVHTLENEFASENLFPLNWSGNVWRELAPFGGDVSFLPATPLFVLTRKVVGEPGIYHEKTRVPISFIGGDGCHLDLFGVDTNGNVQWASWIKNEWPLATKWENLGGGFPAGATVTAVARTPEFMDLFVIGNDGCAYTKNWSQLKGWSDTWQYIGGFFPVGNSIFAVSDNPGIIILHAVGFDGRVYTSNWTAWFGWSGIRKNWTEIGGFFPRNVVPGGIYIFEKTQNLFIPGVDGRIYTSWAGNGKYWSGINNNWTPVVLESVNISKQFIAPKGTAFNTTVTLSIYATGKYRIEFNSYDSGAFGYDFTCRALFQTYSGIVLAFIHTGHVGSTFSSGSRRDDYVEEGYQANIKANWASLKSGYLWMSEDFDLTGLAGTVDSIFKSILDIGAGVVGASVGVILAVGNEAGKLIGGYSLGELLGVVAGAVIIAFGGTAVLAVVSGFGIGEFTDDMIDQEVLTSDELSFAYSVFANQANPTQTNLPDGSLIYKTNLSVGGRFFTMPAGNGRIYLNMGEAFSRLTTYTKSGYPSPGEVFIHELTHAWQIHQNVFMPGTICSGIVTQTNKIAGEDVYGYPLPGADWDTFGVEQQAAIVDQWFGGVTVEGAPNRIQGTIGGKDDPYFQYIQNNIRAGVS